ncbi:MAG: hormogonium polysaccharide biosynthesis protein HpsL [Cyanobacteria bacterium J06588_5]
MVSRSSGKRSIKQSLQRKSKRGKSAQGATDAQSKGTSKRQKSGRGKKGKGKATTAESDSLPVEELSPRQRLILERAAAKRRKETISFIASTFFGCAFLALLVGLFLEPKLGVAAGGALMCLVMAFKYQRLALYAFLIYIPFSGTVTYALGGNSILQIAKDIFYIPALIGVYQFCQKNRLPIILPKAIKPPLIFLIIVVSLTALITNVPDQIGQVNGRLPIVMAIWGAKILFGYIPLVACIYYLIRNKEDLMWLLRMQAVLVLIVSALGFIQYFMLKTGMCQGTVGEAKELFRASLQARCFVGGSLLYAPEVGQIRLPGTFVAPWQWGWFLISGVFFSFGTSFNDEDFRWRIVGLASLVALFTMALVSGQRIALVMVPLLFGSLMIITKQYANLKKFLPVGVLLALVVSYLIVNNPEVVTTRVNSLMSRWEASPPQQFVTEQFSQVWDKQEGLFGKGVGRATNSARTFGKTVLIETYHPKLIYELGPIGLFAVMAMYTTLTVVTFRVYRKTKDKSLRGYAATMWFFIFFISYFPYYYPLDVDPVGVYYWLAAGIILKIPALEQQEKDKLAELNQPPDSPALTAKDRRRRARLNKEVPTFE